VEGKSTFEDETREAKTQKKKEKKSANTDAEGVAAEARAHYRRD
jgi:hypothetical protein